MEQSWAAVSDPAELGATIRRARGERGWDQATLAGRLGVTRMTLSKVERGHAGSVDTALRALAECGYAVAVAPISTQVDATPADD